jgi:hypothetical protein
MMVQPSIQVEVGVHGLRECCMPQGAIESCVDISIQGGGTIFISLHDELNVLVNAVKVV